MDLKAYHAEINQLWENIENQLDNFANTQDLDVDCEIQGQVFTISFPCNQQIVINKQEPLLELWIASRTGGFHCHWQNGSWLTNQGENFWGLLENACASYGYPLKFNR